MASVDCPGKEGVGGRRRNLALLRSKLYVGERRRTEPLVESTAGGVDQGTLRRSQSDRTEYSQKLQGTGEARLVPCCQGCSGLGGVATPAASRCGRLQQSLPQRAHRRSERLAPLALAPHLQGVKCFPKFS